MAVNGWPEGEMRLRSLGGGAATRPGRVEHVERLGAGPLPSWRRTAAGLRVTLPPHRPELDYAAALKMRLA